MTNQPKWKCIGNLGDCNPIDHGGLFVYVDETGVYDPEMELLEVPEDDYYPDDDEEDRDPRVWRVYRVVLDKCTYINGILSDNKYHPSHRAWFAGDENVRPQDSTKLSKVCKTLDMTQEDLIAMLCSDDPVQRACGYRNILDHHGWDNGDQYPLELSHDEVVERYAKDSFRHAPEAAG